MSDNCTDSIMGIDSHAHVFDRALNLAAVRRYTPEYDATLADYLSQLKQHGLSRGVLVQPSFLGTDNRYLLGALEQAPSSLRGVVVVEPGISRDALNHMAERGVVGIRLNLMGKALPDFRESAWRDLLTHVAALNWHVELHRQIEDLPALIGQLMPFGMRLVVDHFGRPDARLGIAQPGFAELLELGRGGQLWMKISGIYRLGGTAEQNLAFASAALHLIEQSFGTHRLVWGSDWPHTQHEQSIGFSTALEQFQALKCSAALTRSLLVDNPEALFGFS